MKTDKALGAVRRIVVLGTGGTIAGLAPSPQARTYEAAQLGVEQLVEQAAPGLAIETQQVAQLDSKDMNWAVWQALAGAVDEVLRRPEVGAVVITHGTDTLEETAYLLDQLLDIDKPVVLTAAMRPANSAQADGPANLRDALTVARAALEQGRAGVVVVMSGRVWAARHVRKVHTHAIDAFGAGGEPPLACLESDDWQEQMAPWPRPAGLGLRRLAGHAAPRVEIVTSHADADGWVVQAMLAHADAGELQGLVVAGTGHGTVHAGLVGALEEASARGVKVWRSSRVQQGGVASHDADRWPAAGGLTPAQARVALQLSCLGVPSSE